MAFSSNNKKFHTNFEPGMAKQRSPHPYHLVTYSPWPVFTAMSVLVLTLGMVLYWHRYASAGIVLSLALICIRYSFSIWWRDVFREAEQGIHNSKVQSGIQLGVLWFITTEAMFFVGLLWAYAHAALMPTVQIGLQWPPVGIIPVDWTALPTVNTVLLFTSYRTANGAKYGMEQNHRTYSLANLARTIGLGVLFTFYQYKEYTHAAFTMSDSVFGCNFFRTTGFHGFHVMVGVAWLAVCLFRFNSYTPNNCLSLQRAILYWHFVDLVWVFRYTGIYAWGCSLPVEAGLEACPDETSARRKALSDAKANLFATSNVSHFKLQN